MLELARKIDIGEDEDTYPIFYRLLRLEMDEYRRLKRQLREMKEGMEQGEEDLYDEAV